MEIIELKNLTKYYGKHLGIENISLTVKKGEMFGFVGPNGSGKSTTIRVLLNLIFKTSGDSFVFGLNTTTDSDKIKMKTGYVPAEVNYYESMNVQDLLLLTLKLAKSNKYQKIDELCQYFELNKKRKIKELSFGNKKKLAVIQALIREPELLILDEPTNGLDPLVSNHLFDLLMELKKMGTTIFLSSHNLTEVEKYCDRVAIIKGGKIILIDEISKIVGKTKNHIRIRTKDHQLLEYDTDQDINVVMKEISQMDIDDVEIRKSTLEEDFLGYYEVK